MNLSAKAANAAFAVTLLLIVSFVACLGMYAYLGKAVLGVVCGMLLFGCWTVGCIALGRKWAEVTQVVNKPYQGLPDMPMGWEGALKYIKDGHAETESEYDSVDPVNEWEEGVDKRQEDDYRRRMQGTNL